MNIYETITERLAIPKRFKSLSAFIIGATIALAVNFICDGEYTLRQTEYALSYLLPSFGVDNNAVTTIFNIIKSIANQTVSVFAVTAASFSIFPYSLITVLSLLRGYLFIRFCGCAVSVSSPIFSFVAILFSVASGVIFLFHCSSVLISSEQIKGKSELDGLFSRQVFLVLENTLTATGSIFLLSIIKSILLWLCTLI